MARGGYRGGGRQRLHLDENGVDHRRPAQFLLTPEVNDMLVDLTNSLGMGRSELIRQLIVQASKDLKALQAK